MCFFLKISSSFPAVNSNCLCINHSMNSLWEASFINQEKTKFQNDVNIDFSIDFLAKRWKKDKILDSSYGLRDFNQPWYFHFMWILLGSGPEGVDDL